MPELSMSYSLPLEIIEQIFGYLDPTSSTTLGLTCRQFHCMHVRRRHGRVPLHSLVDLGGGSCRVTLAGLLTNWMGKPGVELKFSSYNFLYVSKERWEELEAIMWKDAS